MEQLLMNKYKPTNIHDYIYSDAIKINLTKLIHIDEMSFILHGESGCGKTSLLKCIVHSYFGNLKFKDNVLFINNISEQGINYYRNEVKLFCQTNSTIPGKKKLIVFDDFDQINDQCQQVFRNYIDKYDNKIGFLIATSNLHKIINSIQSRFLVINLTKPSRSEVKTLCTHIIKTENINIKNDHVDHILDLTNSTIYRIFNYLEKLKLMGKDLYKYDVKQILTHIGHKEFDVYFEHLSNKNFYDAYNIVMQLHDHGYSVIDILDSLFLYIKTAKNVPENVKYKVIPIVCKYITIFYDIHEDEIELIFLTNNLVDLF